MNRRFSPLVGALLILISVSAIRAEVAVKTEQVDAANPAGKVKAIPGPHKSDIASPPKVTDVWVAFKTHFDIGYTDTIEGVLRKYRVQDDEQRTGDHRSRAAIAAGKTFCLDHSGLAGGTHPRAANKSRPASRASSRRSGKGAGGPGPAVQPAHGIV